MGSFLFKMQCSWSRIWSSASGSELSRLWALLNRRRVNDPSFNLDSMSEIVRVTLMRLDISHDRPRVSNKSSILALSWDLDQLRPAHFILWHLMCNIITTYGPHSQASNNVREELLRINTQKIPLLIQGTCAWNIPTYLHDTLKRKDTWIHHRLGSKLRFDWHQEIPVSTPAQGRPWRAMWPPSFFSAWLSISLELPIQRKKCYALNLNQVNFSIQ